MSDLLGDLIHMSVITRPDAVAGSVVKSSGALRFVWLEITGKCQLSCVHCYADSGPKGTHGVMVRRDWERVIDQASDLGVSAVQFIGGEPTLHPELPALIPYALSRGLDVEVFSNLTHISPGLWEAFSQPGVNLATSYYSDRAEEHDTITYRRGSFEKTTANIEKAVNLGIPLRVGVIGIENSQRVDQALGKLKTIGVDGHIGVDYLRQVGRGIRERQADMTQLCGNCTNGVLAISPAGEVWPCVFSRWMSVGNVTQRSLAEIISSRQYATTQTALDDHFARRNLTFDNLPEHTHGSPIPAELRKPMPGGPKPPCTPPPTPCTPYCVPRTGPSPEPTRPQPPPPPRRPWCPPGRWS